MSETSVQATPIAEPLDEFLRGVVQALHTAADRGIKAADKDPTVAQKTLGDCKEILDVIMAGNVKEWIS